MVQPAGRPSPADAPARTASPAAGTRAAAAWRILRPGNCGMTGIAVAAGAVVAAGPDALATPAPWLAAVAAFLAAGFGNVLNDLYDVAVDKLAHPMRPLPRGDLTTGGARLVAGAAAALALGLGAAVSLAALAFVALSLLVMVVYEVALKSRGLPGNVAVAALTGAPFLFGALAVADVPGLAGGALLLAILAALANLGREVLKDIQDMAADVGRATLPQRSGRAVARQVAAGALVAAVLLSPLPFARGDVGWAYVPFVVVADGVFLAAAFHREAGRAQSLAKVGMLAALAAFLAGRLVAGEAPL